MTIYGVFNNQILSAKPELSQKANSNIDLAPIDLIVSGYYPNIASTKILKPFAAD